VKAAPNPVRHDPAAVELAGLTAVRQALAAWPLLALTQDVRLLAALKRVAGPEHQVRVVGSEVDLSTALLGAHAGVAVLDCAFATTPIATLTDRLHQQFPDLVLIVAGSADEQGALARQITDGSVHRFLHKPVSEQRVRLFVEAAWRRHAEAHAAPAVPDKRRPRPRRAWKWALALAVVAAIATAGLWFGERDFHVALPNALSVAALTQGRPGGETEAVGRLLSRAEAQLEARQLEAAQQLVQQARALSPANPRVAFLATQISAQRAHAAALAARTRAAAGNSNAASAAATAMAASAMTPQAPSTAAPVATPEPTSSAPAPATPRPATPAPATAAPASTTPDAAALSGPAGAPFASAPQPAASGPDPRVVDALARARDAESRGRLIEPRDDSARNWIASARALAPDDPDVQEATQDLRARLESEARQALTERNPDQADIWAAAAADAGAEPADIAALHQRAQELRTASAAPATVTAAAPSAAWPAAPTAASSAGGTATPAAAAAITPPAAAHSTADSQPSQAEGYLGEGALTRTHYVAPKFPDAATRRGIGGWVDLQFLVGADGAVSDLAVVGAQPVGLFEEAALEAVRHWRYQPPMRDGHAVSAHARVRVRFTVQQ
jgi:periplasmic protein TonB